MATQQVDPDLEAARRALAHAEAAVRRLHPDLDDEEVQDLAVDWVREVAEERANREDTPCLDAPWWSQP